jgi:hypothetical protein
MVPASIAHAVTNLRRRWPALAKAWLEIAL